MARTITIERSIWIAAPRQQVWHSITDPAHLGDWWSPDYWEIPSLAVGETITYGFELEVSNVTVVALEPLRKLGVCADPCPVHPDFAPSTMFSLSDEHGGTRLTVTQSGYEGLPDPCRHIRMAECANGYQSVLDNLKGHLEDAAAFANDTVELLRTKTA